jgi:hypothetical protein
MENPTSTSIIHERIFSQMQYTLNILRSLQRRLTHEVEVGDFQTDTPKDLAKLLIELSKVLENHLLWKYFPEFLELKDNLPKLGSNEYARKLRRIRLEVIQAARIAAHLTEYIKYVNYAVET